VSRQVNGNKTDQALSKKFTDWKGDFTPDGVKYLAARRGELLRCRLK
jgi:hypothetical protein